MNHLARVQAELSRYRHTLLDFSAIERNGEVELQIAVRGRPTGLHIYHAPLHPRDLDHPQFEWTFQRYLYDCLHDYMVELFEFTPQSRETRA